MSPAPREVCLSCRRPARVCYCARLPRLQTRTRVVFLQHPREARMPIGTARMAHLALAQSELHQGVCFDAHPRVRELTALPETALLFPGEDATDPHTVAPGSVGHLVVIDGTWWQARKVLKQNPLLQRLPRIGLKPVRAGNYRIRREPTPECLATIEAVSDVLGILEGEPARFERMLEAFTYMVDEQIAHAASRTTPPRRRHQRWRPLTDDDRVIVDRSKVVVVHAEVNGYSKRVAVPGRPELLHLVARRGGTQTFEATLVPRRPLAPNAALHLELAPERFFSGESIETTRARWRAFTCPDDLFTGWGGFTRQLLNEEGLTLPQYVDMRHVVARRRQSSPGSPEAAIAALGGGPFATVAPGRAGRMVGQIEEIISTLARTGSKKNGWAAAATGAPEAISAMTASTGSDDVAMRPRALAPRGHP